MTKVEEFKNFVKKNPKLIKYTKNGDMTWQRFYELFDLYGEDNEIWNNYLKEKQETKKASEIANFTDLLGFVKNIDLDSIQNGVNSIQRVLSVVQDLTIKDSSTPKTEYKPRPLYKHFED